MREIFWRGAYISVDAQAVVTQRA